MILCRIYFGSSPICRVYQNGKLIWESKNHETLSLAHIIDWILRSNEDVGLILSDLTPLQKNCLCVVDSEDDLNVRTFNSCFYTYDIAVAIHDDGDKNLLGIPILFFPHKCNNTFDVLALYTSTVADALSRMHTEDYKVYITELATSIIADAVFGMRDVAYHAYVTELATSIIADAVFGARARDYKLYVIERVTSTAAYARFGARDVDYALRVTELATSTAADTVFGARDICYKFVETKLATSIIASGLTETFFKRRLQLATVEDVNELLVPSKIAHYDTRIRARFKTDGGDPVSQIVILYESDTCSLPTISDSFLECVSANRFNHNLIDRIPKIEDINFVCCEVPSGLHTQNQFEMSDLDLLNAEIASLSLKTACRCETETHANMSVYFPPIQTDTNLYIPQAFATTQNDTNLKII